MAKIEAKILEMMNEHMGKSVGQIDPELDTPSQNQFRRRLGKEVPHMYRAFQTHIENHYEDRISALEKLILDLSGLCNTVIDIINDKYPNDNRMKEASQIILPRRS